MLLDHSVMFESIDWGLLSYNSGPVLVRKLKNKYNHPSEIKREEVCKETYDYLRKIHAVQFLLQNKEVYNLNIDVQNISFVEHKISGGDNLTKLARKYGSTVEDIMNYNGFKHKSRIPVNYVARIPIRS